MILLPCDSQFSIFLAIPRVGPWALTVAFSGQTHRRRDRISQIEPINLSLGGGGNKANNPL